MLAFFFQKIEGSNDENLLTLSLQRELPLKSTFFFSLCLNIWTVLATDGMYLGFQKVYFAKVSPCMPIMLTPRLLQPLARVVSTQALPWWVVDAAGKGLRAHIQSECRTKIQKSPPQWSCCFVFSFSCFSLVFQETCQNTVTTACNHPF